MHDDTERRLQITTESLKDGRISVVAANASTEIDVLRRQLDAAKIVIAGLDRRAIDHGAERAVLIDQAADVASERAANAVLTAEIERMRADRDNLRVAPLAADPNNPRMLNFPMIGWVAVKIVRAIERAHGIG